MPHHAARRRIPEAQQLVINAHVQAEPATADGAFAGHHPRRHRLVLASHQPIRLQPRHPARKDLARGIEQPALRHAHLGVAAQLLVPILRLRTRRRHLQHPVRRLALAPDVVGPALVRADAEGDQHVRRDAVAVVAALRIHEDVRRHQRPRTHRPEVGSGVHDRVALPHVLGHGLTVAARVEDVLLVQLGDVRDDCNCGCGRQRWWRWHGCVLRHGLLALLAAAPIAKVAWSGLSLPRRCDRRWGDSVRTRQARVCRTMPLCSVGFF